MPSARTSARATPSASSPATPDGPPRYLALTKVHDSGRPNVSALEVLTKAGIVRTEPFRVSMRALVWLDEAQCDWRQDPLPTPRPRRRTRVPTVH